MTAMTENDCADSDWKEEADAVIRDVRQHVHQISVSNLPSSKKKIYFNLTTLEQKDFCVELTQEGFRIVGEKYDSQDKQGKYSVFETPYTMLDNLSPAYRDSFNEQLMKKLTQLQEEQSKEENSSQEESNTKPSMEES